MKSKIISILALLLTVTQGAWAWSGSGTQADPYLITSPSDWNQLVSSTTYFGSGKYYQLTADISVTSPVSRDASLQGTFDGNGHTITLTYSTSTKYDGLFPYIENLTVKNLHVAGTITTSNECAAGIAGHAQGTNYIKNCRVSITISSSLSGKGYHGGLVAAVKESGSHVYIDNCSFDGGLTGHNTSYWCGFIGWSDYLNQVSISNSYFRPRNLNVKTDDFHPFSHVQQTYTNCLYTFFYSNQTPGDYSSEEGISSSASLSAYGVINRLGSDNWKSVTESSVEYVVPIWQYTIFFDANGGSGAPAAQTKKDGTDLTLSSDVPTRDGYTFTGWNTAADGSGTSYAAGATYSANAAVTLYAQWTENTATLTDGDDLSALSTYAGKTCTVTYSRSFTADKPSTVCLPFAYATASAGGTFYTFTGISKPASEYIADMTEYTGANLVANTPYLFKASATGSVNFGGTYAIPADLTAGTTTSGDWTFVGTYTEKKWDTAPTGIYGFSAQNVGENISQGEFVKVGAYVRVKPMRCYLKYKNGGEDYAGARAMTRAAATDEPLPETIKVRLIGANGEVTAIGTLHTQTGEVVLDGWYTLDGTRLSGQPTRKGIYVNNGKKVIIK